MQGKNGPRPRGPSIGSESMAALFNDDPFMHSLGLFGNGGQLGSLSHTPPSFTPGSYEVSHMKRARAGSISGRLRSASDLEEKGLIDKSQKGALKDLIISGDAELQAALDLYDKGDASQLEALMKNGLLKRRESFDLFENLDFGIMELGMSDEEPTSNSGPVDPVLMRVGPEDKSGVLGDEQIAKVSPPPVPMTTAATAENAASAASSSVSAFRNGGTLEEGTAARPSFAGGAGNYSAQGGGGSGIQAGVGAGPAGGSGAHGGEQDMDLAGEGLGNFDIGEMAFDATFDHEYGEQEDVTGQMPPSSSSVASAGPVGASSVVSPAVGPMRVVGSTSENKLAPPNLISSRGVHHRDDNAGNDNARRPAAGDHDGSEEEGHGHEDEDETDDSDSEGSQDGGGGGGVVMSDDEGGGGEGCCVDSDVLELGSFSTMGAVIGAFSPQFKFSFTDDIHLDLGGGLKDELRDLDSLSEPRPANHGRGGDLTMGLSAFRAQQLLSRGGPAVRSDMPLPPSSRLGTTRSGTAAAAKASAAAAAAAAADTGSEAAAATADSGGYATNHYASGAAYHGRHTGPYATAAEAATGHVKAEVGSAAPAIQSRPHGSSAAAVAAAAAAAGGKDGASTGLYGRDRAAAGAAAGAAAAAAGGATPTHHAARGRPVVSGMSIMVGGGPRIGVSGGAEGGENKVGAYSPEARRQRIERFLEKRKKRVWTKMVKYDVRKNFADTRMRVKGRFVKKEDEAMLRQVMACA